MPNFICKVMTPQGQITSLKIKETDKISCLKKLKRNNMTPISVKRGLSFSFNFKNKNTALVYAKRKKSFKFENKEIKISNKVSLDEIEEFTQELYFLKKSKFTNSHALATIINKTENDNLKKVLRDILKDLETGTFMYKTMEQYNDIFPMVYVNLIKNGELTGSLEKALQHAVTYLESEKSLRKKFTEKLMPNIITFFGIIILAILSLVLGIPMVQDLFISGGNNIALPKITLIASKICVLIVNRWYITVGVLSILIFIGIRYIYTEKGRYEFDYFKYRNSLFGKCLYLLDFSKWIRCIAINVQNKIRFQDALEISKNVVKNTYLLNKIEKSISNVYLSKSWIEPFEEELSPIIIEMLKKEKSSNDVEIFQKTIEYMDIQIENEINELLNRLSKISLIVIGIVLLLFILIVLIPCITVYLSNFLFI